MTNYKVYFSTRPAKRAGSDEVWDKAELALETALKNLAIPYTVNPGDGAFYGPKLDVIFFDAIERPWQLGTIQCDFVLPERFSLSYTGEDNTDHRPVMLHRAILGSLERFIGVYLEHTAGHLPTWLAPVQVRVLNVTDRQEGYGKELAAELRELKVRAEFDGRNEKLGYKIREAQIEKVPYMLVIGDKEVENQTVTVRLKNGSQLEGMPKLEFFKQILADIKLRSLLSPMATAATALAPKGKDETKSANDHQKTNQKPSANEKHNTNENQSTKQTEKNNLTTNQANNQKP